MKFLLAILSIAGSALVAEACPVQVQSSCGVGVQAFAAPSCAVQSFSVAPAAVAVQSFAVVPQAVHVQSVVPLQQVSILGPGCGHGCGRVQVFGGNRVKVFGGGRQTIRQRSVIRSR